MGGGFCCAWFVLCGLGRLSLCISVERRDVRKDGSDPGDWGSGALVLGFWFLGGQLESLILAQNERWRHA